MTRKFAVLCIAIITLALAVSVAYAEGEHSGHGALPAAGDITHSPGESQSHQENSQDSHESDQGGHNEADFGSQSGHGEGSSGHGDDGSGHGKSEPSMSDQTKNIVVGVFAGVNALVIGIALYQRNKSQRGLGA